MIWLVIAPAAVGFGWLLGRGDAVANARMAVEIGPVGALWLTLGMSLGLYGRDRTRRHRSYPSPTLSYLGKRLLLASITAAATYTFSPVGWPSDWLEPISIAAGLGLAVWVGNLPRLL